MKYIKSKQNIKILQTDEFNIKQILECGQIFRFQIDENYAVVYSKDKRAVIKESKEEVVIETNDVDYFEHFFDLKTDYSTIKSELKKDEFLSSAVDYGYGIRILNNDVYEMIVSFIISANNNIARIKKSIECLCEKFGTYNGDYYAFPTLKQLKNASVEDFKNAGLGYRSTQLFETLQTLNEKDVENLKQMDAISQFDFLVSLKGVGEKVANCIMLFGLGVKTVFPVDTWINKVYNKLTNSVENDRKKISKELSSRYGALSGYAQQYVFYYFRDNKLK